MNKLQIVLIISLLSIEFGCQFDSEEGLLETYERIDSLQNKIPSIRILAPSAKDTVVNPVTFEYRLEKWNVGIGGFHVQYFINQENRGFHYGASRLTIADLDTGYNVVRLQLALPNFRTVQVYDEIALYLKPPDPSTFPLVVNYGTGSGNYTSGTIINLVAEVPEDHEFVVWQGDIQHLSTNTSPETVLVMPAEAVEVTAVFQPRKIDFASEILPIFNSECTACHSGLYVPNLTTCENIKANAALVKQMINNPNNPMPPDGLMEQSKIDLINRWMDQGANCSN